MKGKWMILLCAAAVAAVEIAGCDNEEGPGAGTLKFAIWGEEFIEEGIPAEEFDDGWAVTFDKFVVLVHDVSTGEEAGEEGRLTALTGCAAFDLAKPGPVVLATLDAEATPYHDTAYAIAPATACTAAVGTAEAADVEAMTQAGYSVYVTGHASKEGVEKSFAWGFSRATDYVHCHSEAEVTDGGEATIQLTIHGDHFFYNSLTNPEAGLAFQTLADADADGDGEVTMDELEAFGGDAFKALDNYDVGDLPVENLYDYLQEQSATLGHIDGEGHCEVE
jgi:hypothetical protein